MTLFSERPGAVVGTHGIDHFGDPMREQRDLRAGEALAPLGDLAVVEVAGEDRLSWLDSITSQSLTGLTPGGSTELLILDPQGRVEHAAAVFDDGASTWLLADAGDVEAMAAWLSRMVFRARASVTVRPELTAVGFFPGGAAEDAARGAAIAPAGVPVVWRDPWPEVQPGGHQYARTAVHPASDYHWQVAILDDAGAAAVASLPLAGTFAAEALRVAAWRPRWQSEVDERALPHEVDWLRTAVHLNKGCYRGQETVAKVHNLGHPPRRLVALDLDGSDDLLPEPGAIVHAGDTEIGHVTSVARHYEDGPIALALIRRRADEGPLTVRVGEGEVAATPREIVPSDAGATANVPRLTRLSRRPSAGGAGSLD